jgi:predicted nucleic acid-binding protein
VGNIKGVVYSYLSEKKRIPLNLREVRKLINGGDNYRIVDLGPDIVETASGIKGLEIFDRLIVGTAKLLGVPLVTSDKEIKEKGGVQVVWSQRNGCWNGFSLAGDKSNNATWFPAAC